MLIYVDNRLLINAKDEDRKLPAGLSNPTIHTVNAIAMAFGKELKIEFVSR